MIIKLCKKTISIIVLSLVLCISSFAFLLTNSYVKGNTEIENENDEFQIDGAQVRLTDPAGIRFVTNVDKDDCIIEDTENGGYKLIENRVFGTLLIPTEFMAHKNSDGLLGDLTLANWQQYGAINVVADKWQIGLEEMTETTQYFTYTAVLVGSFDSLNGIYTGFASSNYNVKMTAISYYYDNNDVSTAVLTAPVERSLAGVAATLLASDYNDNTGYLAEIVDTVIGEDGISFSEGNVFTSQELANVTLTLIGNEGLEAKWVSSDPTVATVDANGVITANKVGKCVITATIGSKVASCEVTFGTPVIKLPETIQECIAGEAYTIPEAQIYFGEELSLEKPTVTAVFKGTYDNGDGVELDTLVDYVAPSSGVITVTYSSAGVESQTLEIQVTRAAVSQTTALDFSSSDVIGDMQAPGANNVLEYVKDDAMPYVKWYISGNAKQTWQMFKIQSTVSDVDLNNYDYVKVKLRALSNDGTYRWRALMCSNAYITGPDGAIKGGYTSPERLSLNEWNDVLIPMSAFKKGNGFDKSCFISVTFNGPKDGNADNVYEVDIAGFELVNFGGGINATMFTTKNTNNALLTRVDANENDGKPYVSWTIFDDSTDTTAASPSTWRAIYFNKNSAYTATSLRQYSYVKVKVKAIGNDYYGTETPGSRKWRPYFCSDIYVIGESGTSGADYDSSYRLTFNEWHDVYIPMNVFVDYGYGADDANSDVGYFLSTTFNINGDGNANNVSEVRIGGIEFVNENPSTIVYKKTTSLFTPDGTSNHTAFTCSGATITSLKGAGGNGGVFSNFVSVKCTTAGWKNISFMFPTTINYSQYSYLEFWVYADTGTYGSYDVTFSFFNDTNYQRTFKSNSWVKVVIKATTVQAKLVTGNKFVPVNFNSTGSPMHKNVKGFYFGPMYGVGYAQ